MSKKPLSLDPAAEKLAAGLVCNRCCGGLAALPTRPSWHGSRFLLVCGTCGPAVVTGSEAKNAMEA